MHHTASHVFGYNWGYVDYNLLALYGRVLVLKNTHFSVLMNFMGSFCLFHGVCSNACGMQLNKKHKQWLTYGLFGLHTQMHAETMSVGSYQFLFLFSRHFFVCGLIFYRIYGYRSLSVVEFIYHKTESANKCPSCSASHQ